jgi:hypothetical protein
LSNNDATRAKLTSQGDAKGHVNGNRSLTFGCNPAPPRHCSRIDHDDTSQKKNKPSEVALQIKSDICAALLALNQIDPAALNEWLGDPDFAHIDADDRALIESLGANLLPITRELDFVFDTLEKAGEQLGLLAPDQFRAEPTSPPKILTFVRRPIDCRDLKAGSSRLNTPATVR